MAASSSPPQPPRPAHSRRSGIRPALGRGDRGRCWRKNRRPRPAGQPPTCKGVDLNRNYPVPGDYQVYYSIAAEPAVSGKNHGRDGSDAPPYNEFIPNNPPNRLQDAHGLVGGQMRDAIVRAAGGDQRARTRSRYDVEPAVDMYPAPGVSSDFAFSRNLVPGTPRPLISFRIECGSDQDLEGGFQPPVVAYPKIEREVQLALLALLAYAAAQPKP